jgi:HlyD family secretion protein
MTMRSAVGIALLLTACRWPWEAPDAGALTVPGTVEAYQVDVAFQVGGRIVELPVDEGEAVAAGTPIARLDADDYQLALARAHAEAQAAAATLAALRAGTRVQEIRVAEAAVEQAQARVAFARSEVHRIDELVPKKLASEQQLDQARLQLEVAITELAQAQQRLRLLREGPRPEDIERAAAEHAASLQAVALAERQLAYTRLLSPVAGVISVRLAERGEVVSPGQPIVTVARLATPWVRAYLSESELARVQLGQPASVHADGLPGQVFSGRLAFISPVAEFTPKTVETRDLRTDLVYRIKVDVVNPEGRLKIGMPVDVTLDLPPPPPAPGTAPS